MRILKRVLVFLILGILIISSKVNASYLERINEYKSEIFINEDSSMVVEETIKVYAAGEQIKRGIYRDFPTKYKDKTNNSYKVGFEVLEVLKDGKTEKYKTEKLAMELEFALGMQIKL